MKKDDCIFCRIAAGEIPSKKVYEDDDILAFHDIQPAAPVHFLMIPKAHVGSLSECGPEHAPVLGRMMTLAGRLAREQGSPDGFRTIVNTGRVGRQDVYHLHIHIIGGPDRLPRMIAAE
jgi:histidine triad (HIT) family protein